LRRHTGKKPDRLRPLIGRWCRDFGDALFLDAPAAAQTHDPIEPISWIEQRLATNHRRSKPSHRSGIIPMHPRAGS
jgi:hypothetical protein